MRTVVFAVISIFASVAAVNAASKVTVEDIKKLTAKIEADAGQMKSYCEMSKLYAQAFEAGEKKDEKKADELSKKADELGKSLGGDYEKVMEALQEVDPESEEGKKLVAAFEPLDKKCQ